MINKFGIHIKSKDIEKSFKFYRSLGLRPIFTYGRKDWLKNILSTYKDLPHADEQYEGITFEIGNSLLEIANGHIAVKEEVFKQGITSSKVSAMIDTDSVDNIISICNANNYEITKEPVIYPWGTREVVIKDPDGLILVFREFIK